MNFFTIILPGSHSAAFFISARDRAGPGSSFKWKQDYPAKKMSEKYFTGSRLVIWFWLFIKNMPGPREA